MGIPDNIFVLCRMEIPRKKMETNASLDSVPVGVQR